MSEKFKYAPGKPGFGTKGDRGEDGQQGLSMYFTDINPATSSAVINSKIVNNQVLWADIYDSLPDGRIYVTGDLFFDTEGKAYEINAGTGTFQYKYASLNMGGFFLPLGASSDSGFERYFNSNASPKYIIDNVYTESGAIDYTNVPENIYGIEPKDFTRIEFTNIKPGTGVYNAFTVYSSGEIVPTDNNKAIAIVYDETNNAFRIGNLDEFGTLRNTDLIFDVSLLQHTKQAGSYFGVDTPEGAVLTNYEINANELFNPNFDRSPASFIGSIQTSDCSIRWVLADFLNGEEPDSADLYFFENNNPYNNRIFNFNTDVSARPLIVTGVDSIGSIKITGTNNTKVYGYYMRLFKNGWARTSDTKYLFGGTVSVTPTSLLSEPSAAHAVGSPYYFNVDANTIWDVSFGSASWITNLTTTSTGYDGSIGFELTENTGSARNATMKVTVTGGTYQNVAVSQLGAISNVTINISEISHNTISIPCGEAIDASYGITLTGLPADTVVNIQYVERIYGYKSGGANFVEINAPMIFKKNASSYLVSLSDPLFPSSGIDVSAYVNVPTVTSADALSVNMSGGSLYARESLDVPCESDWYVHVYFYVYVTYVSGTPINILNNGTSWGFTIPSA
jgi:hypothetical protein